MRNGRTVLIAHDRRIACGKVAEYKLIKHFEREWIYLIVIFYCGEKIIHRVSGKISEAALLYDLIVRNTVTPCTLLDIIEDLAYQKG